MKTYFSLCKKKLKKLKKSVDFKGKGCYNGLCVTGKDVQGC